MVVQISNTNSAHSNRAKESGMYMIMPHSLNLVSKARKVTNLNEYMPTRSKQLVRGNLVPHLGGAAVLRKTSQGNLEEACRGYGADLLGEVDVEAHQIQSATHGRESQETGAEHQRAYFEHVTPQVRQGLDVEAPEREKIARPTSSHVFRLPGLRPIYLALPVYVLHKGNEIITHVLRKNKVSESYMAGRKSSYAVCSLDEARA